MIEGLSMFSSIGIDFIAEKSGKKVEFDKAQIVMNARFTNTHIWQL